MFDPTSDQVPWVGAGRLMSLLWQPVSLPDNTRGIEIAIARKGWPEIRLPFGESGAEKLPLEPDDVVRLVIAKSDPDPVAPAGDKDWWVEPSKRLTRVTLTSPGIPYTRHFGTTRPADVRAPAASLPTLLQMLAETLVPENRPGAVPQDAADFPSWLAENGAGTPITLLPHPDFSKIRLRRLNDAGKEDVRDIDLAAAIEALTEATTVDEVRRADHVLQPGDLIELPLRQDRSGEPWKGLTPKEAAFFSKALSCRVQFIDAKSTVGLREVRYAPVPFIDTAFGWYPLRPENSDPGLCFSLRASMVLGYSGELEELTREGGRDPSLDLPADQVFLRDGDAVRASRIIGSPRPPRQSVLPR